MSVYDTSVIVSNVGTEFKVTGVTISNESHRRHVSTPQEADGSCEYYLLILVVLFHTLNAV